MEKFKDQKITAKGEPRAFVSLTGLKTLWFNTGTLCNLECANCYIESSPTNDRLSYITAEDVGPFLNEIKTQNRPTELIGLTGGEPFLNPHIIAILKSILSQGLDVLVLTNANRVLKKHHSALLDLKAEYGTKLKLRVSLDHHTADIHDKERGKNAFAKTTEELIWLYENGFDLSIASRSLTHESQEESLAGHRELLANLNISIDLSEKLVVFPEMDSKEDVPEITTACWDILSKKPDEQMCASERMIVKKKGETKLTVMPCTLLAYDEQFNLGSTLKDAETDVYLNHKFCSEFCVLGGASCSSAK